MIQEIITIIIIVCAVAFAVYKVRIAFRKKNKSSCCENCENCAQQCKQEGYRTPYK